MFKGRDFAWALAICLGLTLFFHYRPLWSARRFVQEQSLTGFQSAYAGSRWVSGQLITSERAAGAEQNVFAPIVMARRLNIQGETVSFDGKRAEFVVKHVVKLAGGVPGQDEDVTDVHVKLHRRGSRWTYEHFQVRGRDPVEAVSGNPWTEAVRYRDEM